MRYLRWIGCTSLFIWLLGLIFSFWGAFIHFLLIVAASVFIYDFICNQRKKV